MTSRPLVSISCLTFNHAPFIRQCLDGFFIQQCDFEFEVLIHDDASSDGTSSIIREYQERHPGIIKPIFQTENQYSRGIRGIMAQFNFPRAKGKYIALCEGDDYWTDPLKLQKQVEFLERNIDFSMCFHKVDILVGEKKYTNNYHGNKPRTYTSLDLAKENFINTLSVMFKTGEQPYFFEYPDFPVYGDYIMYLYFSTQGKIRYLSDNMGVYRKHSEGMWSGEDNIKRLTILRSTINYLIPLVTKDVQQVLSEQGIKVDAQQANEYILRNEIDKAQEILTYGLGERLDRFETWLRIFHLEVRKQNDQFPRGLKETFFYFLKLLFKRIKDSLFHSN